MAKASNREIEDKYENDAFKVAQERNDFLLPQIIDFVKNKKWMNLRPEYQRRLVWDSKKRSQFIESILMNLPVPPVFLFEWEYSRYEVIDGQQRLTTISDFYANKFKLSGLEKWPELNTKSYLELPPKIQRGLDRRRISAVVVLTESIAAEEKKDDIRRLMFERLNTGGQNLNAQELRNCFYSGTFNDTLIQISSNRLFTDVWEIPNHKDNITGDQISAELAGNSLFKRMGDCEIALRYFAFKKKSNIKGSVRAMLDRCMEEHKEITEKDAERMLAEYISRLNLAFSIFDKNCFRITEESGKTKLSLPFSDAIMVSLDRLFDERTNLVSKKKRITAAINTSLKDENNYDLIVSRANTAEAIKERISFVENVIRDAIK